MCNILCHATPRLVAGNEQRNFWSTEAAIKPETILLATRAAIVIRHRGHKLISC